MEENMKTRSDSGFFAYFILFGIIAALGIGFIKRSEIMQSFKPFPIGSCGVMSVHTALRYNPPSGHVEYGTESVIFRLSSFSYWSGYRFQLVRFEEFKITDDKTGSYKYRAKAPFWGITESEDAIGLNTLKDKRIVDMTLGCPMGVFDNVDDMKEQINAGNYRIHDNPDDKHFVLKGKEPGQ